MPTFRPLRVKGARYGLNTHDRPEDLRPGEAVEALNVKFENGTVSKRKGHTNFLVGGADNVLKGGASAQSIYVVGDEQYIEHDKATLEAIATTSVSPRPYSRRDFYHHRQGIIIIPEGNLDEMRLNIRSGDPDWAIEFPIWTDNLPLLRYGASDVPFNVVVAAKSQNTSNSVNASSQWAVRIIPDSTSTERFHIVLTLYEGSVHTAGTDFYYQSGSDRAWVEPGRRIWVAWKFNDAGPTITSYYWIEGQTSVVSSTQSVSSTLRTNGVGGSTYPISIGRRLVHNNDEATPKREMGFNGCVSDLRFWDSTVTGTLDLPTSFGTVTADPPASTDWYVESEIPDEQLTTDTGIENGNIAQDYSLRAYWQFKPELLGVEPDGTATAEEKSRIIRPRYRDDATLEPKAWLTGADASWVESSGALGDFALALTPVGPSGQKYIYGDALISQTTAGNIYGYRTFRGGVRIPYGNEYLNKATDSYTNTYEWPGAFSVRIAVRVDALPSSTSYKEILWEMAVVRRGTATNYDYYAVKEVLQLSVTHNGSNWIFRWRVIDGSGSYTNVDSTTTVTEGNTYVVCGTARWWSTNSRKLAIYLNGDQEATSTATGTKPYLSETSRVDATAENEDDEDGRDGCIPMSIGYTNTTIENPVNTPPNPWLFRFGTNSINGVAAPLSTSTRGYWAFHNNECRKDPNSGVPYRGDSPLVGLVGSLQIWRNHELNESEARRFADRGPTEQEAASYGSKLASSWDMEEGQGTLIYDRGYLKNHIPLNPYSTAKVQAGVFSRYKRAPILGIATRRERQVRSGSPVREVYAIATGGVHKVKTDGSGDYYLEPIGRMMTPQMFDQSNEAVELPTWFSFSDQIYICSGLGPVKRITNGKLLDAGLTPVYGDLGQDQTNLGWREFDRDGTFGISVNPNLSAPASQLFVEDGRYGYCVTHYDPESGIESPPSRKIFFTLESGTGYGAYAIQLYNLPKSPQRNVTKLRIYRTALNGSEFKFVEEIDAAYSWYDFKADTELGSAIDSDLNFPPPQNARLGISFGARAIYSGVKQSPGTVYYSLLGQPGSVPPQYQITFPEEVTALLPYNDRVLVGTLNRWYALFDTGGDIAIDSADAPPVQYAVITEETGCISHHGCVMVPGIGWVFPGERGIYATNGSEFRYLSQNIKPYWDTLNFNAAPRFVGVLNQRDHQYILYHSLADDQQARNTRAIAFDYINRAFSTFDSLDVVNVGTVEDEDSGVDRIMVTDRFGDIWEYAPPDVDVYADGVSASPYTGTVVDASLDGLESGNYVRIKLTSGGTLPTDGSGLRGVNLFILNGTTPWNTEPCKIIWNDSNWVLVESLNADTTDPTGYSWKLGAYMARWTSGKMDLGAPELLKKTNHARLEYGEVGGTSLTFSFKWDEQTAQTFSNISPAHRFDAVAPILGRGRNCQISFYDTSDNGGLSNNPWEVREVEWLFHAKGRATYIGS